MNVTEVEAEKQGAMETQAALNELAKAKKTIRDLQERNLFLESRGKKKTATEPEGSSTYLMEQIDFMRTQICKMERDLEDKELTIDKLFAEKHEWHRRYTVLEAKFT